jgi:PAS domain S-box-containing protein
MLQELGPLWSAVHDQVQRAKSSIKQLPPGVSRDPVIIATLDGIQVTLQAQLNEIRLLAVSRDWIAIRRRLETQIRPLESLSSDLVEKVDHEVGLEQARSIEDTKRSERRALFTVPIISVLTLLSAVMLGLAITRSITQPLHLLTQGSRALARGDFSYQVAAAGEDELADLANVFNDTSRRLRELYTSLQRSEDQLRLVINTVPAMVWSTSPDGEVDFLSERWRECTGRPIEDGLRWSWETVVHPEDLAGFTAKWRNALASGQPLETEARVRMANGDYRWRLISNVPLRDKQGAIVKWYGSSTDVQDRKDAEEERERLRYDLAHINRVNTLGELTASLAHEIKQPIAASVANASACLRMLKSQTPDLEEACEAASGIVTAGMRAGDIIDRLRSLYMKSRPQRGLVEANEIIREMVVLMRGEANRYGLSMRTNLAPDLPRIMADRVQLQQVLMNLMLNGIEAMKETGGVLTVKSQLDQDDKLLISVSDTGVGLPAERADQIFNAFFTTKPEGSGMGLAISRSILESHGGSLWATSDNGRGATFHFTLPTAAEQVKVPAAGT